jgi:hypothetical protein
MYACVYIYIAIAIGQIFVIFDAGDIYGNLSRKFRFVKVGQKRRGTSKANVLLLPATLNRHTSALDSNLWRSDARGMHRCVPTARVITQTRHRYVMLALLGLL